MSKDARWDLLNAVFRERRQALLDQLKTLDVWYEEQFVLHDLSSSESKDSPRLSEAK